VEFIVLYISYSNSTRRYLLNSVLWSEEKMFKMAC